MLIRIIEALHGSAKQRGAVASEYAVLLTLIAVVLVTAMTNLQGAIAGAINAATGAIN